jgi:hypothetical protein
MLAVLNDKTPPIEQVAIGWRSPLRLFCTRD